MKTNLKEQYLMNIGYNEAIEEVTQMIEKINSRIHNYKIKLLLDGISDDMQEMIK